MKINIRKNSKESLSKKKIRDFVLFCANELKLSKKMQKNITIIVNFLPLNFMDGTTEFLDDNLKPREFLININKRNNKKRQLITLAHEMVHVKQYVKGELYEYVSARYHGRIRWKKMIYKYEDSFFLYLFSPWEKEAYKKERKLYRAYLEYIKNNADLA